MAVIGATGLEPVNVLGSFVEGMELGELAKNRRLQQAEKELKQRQEAQVNELLRANPNFREAAFQNQLLGMGQVGREALQSGLNLEQSRMQLGEQDAKMQAMKFNQYRDRLLPVNDQNGWTAWRNSMVREYSSTIPEIETMIPERFTPDAKRNMFATSESMVPMTEYQRRSIAIQEEQNRRLSQQPTFATGEQFRPMTAKEVKDAGFPVGTVAQKDLMTGEIKVLSAVPEAQRLAAPKTSDPGVNRVEAAVKKLTSQMDKIKTGAITGTLSRVFDASDAKQFETFREQLSGAVRAALRIPGEGTLSDQEQRQYGFQLPSLNQTKENNIQTMAALLEQVRLAKGMQPLEAETTQVGEPEEQADFVFENGRLVPARKR
jgi:hypothetical protein